MSLGPLEVVLVVQFALVSVFLLRALLRARTLGPTARSAATGTALDDAQRLRGPAAGRGHGEQLDAIASLVAERHRLEQSLALMRDQHVREEADIRERERAALHELIAHQRARLELTEAEPLLFERIDGLRSEVEHLERRRDALRGEVAASTQASQAMRERILRGRPELEALRRDRELLHRRLIGDRERLRDLAQRRVVLRAETEALAAELELLQRLVDEPLTLTHLSDGPLREDDARRGRAATRSAATGVPVIPAAPVAPAPGPVLATARRR